jgi:predicted RNA binding protein YcfA (HicA-like mRNA interferase family)
LGAAAERLGFHVENQVGSHVKLAKNGLRVIVPAHRILAVGTLKSILRQSEVSIKDLLNAI